MSFKRSFHTYLDYSHLKPFGCTCFVILQPHEHSKLKRHERLCCFLSYEIKHKDHRCRDPISNNITPYSLLKTDTLFLFIILPYPFDKVHPLHLWTKTLHLSPGPPNHVILITFDLQVAYWWMDMVKLCLRP